MRWANDAVSAARYLCAATLLRPCWSLLLSHSLLRQAGRLGAMGREPGRWAVRRTGALAVVLHASRHHRLRHLPRLPRRYAADSPAAGTGGLSFHRNDALSRAGARLAATGVHTGRGWALAGGREDLVAALASVRSPPSARRRPGPIDTSVSALRQGTGRCVSAGPSTLHPDAAGHIRVGRLRQHLALSEHRP